MSWTQSKRPKLLMGLLDFFCDRRQAIHGFRGLVSLIVCVDKATGFPDSLELDEVEEAA